MRQGRFLHPPDSNRSEQQTPDSGFEREADLWTSVSEGTIFQAYKFSHFGKVGMVTPNVTVTAGHPRPKPIIGVMGPAENARTVDLDRAYHLGQRIGQQGWILLTGGRGIGVMEAASRGAKETGGLTIGILPGATSESVSTYVDIPICTDVGYGRNNINGLTSAVLIACGMGLGTTSEVALALKNQKPVILLGVDATSQMFFRQLCNVGLYVTREVEETIDLIKRLLKNAF